MAEFEVLRLDPFQSTIRALIHVDDDLVIEIGKLANAFDADFKKCKIIPSWNDDAKSGWT
jgi:hypothetical protein